MTGHDIFALACSYISQTPAESDDLAALAPAWLTLLAAETLPYENALRAREGMETLERAPRFASLEEEVPYRAALCVPALALGLAAQLFVDDENDARAADFQQRYLGALDEAQRVGEEPITDWCGGGC